MLKKTISFTDYFGEERTQDFYFNLTKSELMEMNLSANGGVERLIEKIIQTKDSKQLVAYFKDFILKSYGEKSDDGFQFMKSRDISRKFEQSPAYDILFMELVADANKAADFINAVIPKEISEKMEENREDLHMNPALAKIQGKVVPLASAQGDNKEDN